MRRGILSILIVLLFGTISNGQFLIGMSIGGTGYQGDISPFSARASFVANNKLAYHFEAGIQYNRYMNLKLGYLSGKISASDRNSSTEGRVSRNLSFRSKIKELALTAEIDLLELLRPNYISKRWHPFVKFGVGIFYFNPQTTFRGELVDLQPIGTEGQGLAAYPDRKKYSLYQLSIPFGIGLKYDIDEKLNISGVITPRITFTDYIDDVSESYPDYDIVKEGNGQLAADLADRSWEIEGERIYEAGTNRGNSSENDWFFYIGVKVNYSFEMRRVKAIFNKNYRLVTCKTY